MAGSELAPIVLFCYNRPDALLRTLEALSACRLAAETDLYLFVDGPAREEEREKVSAVRKIAEAAEGFRSVSVQASEGNRGLGPSIIAGVSAVLDRHPSVIVMEDDLRVMPDFLQYMNEGLRRYRAEKSVFSVCGYSNRVKAPSGYAFDAYFCPRSSSWGWGTWQDRWASIDWQPTRESLRKNACRFNRWGGSDCSKMLRDWMDGKNKSWAIRFCYSQFLQDKVSVFPLKSLVDPSGGFSGEGTNCKKYSRFRTDLQNDSQDSFRWPKSLEVLPSFRKSALHYHSLLLRLWSRLMYVWYR